MKRCRGGNAKKAAKANEESEVPKKSENSLLSLPFCVWLIIFLQLPASAISACKCVCKRWYGLISDPSFSSLYLKNPPYINLVLNMKQLSSPRYPEAHAHRFHLLEFRKDDYLSQIQTSARRLRLPKKECIVVQGSCHGLLCLVECSNDIPVIHISNPMTGEYISLPKLNTSLRIYNSVYGFGFSTHYKVVMIHTLQLSSGTLRVKAQIFTIGVDKKWRKIVGSMFTNCLKGTAITVNGAFHWTEGPIYFNNSVSLPPIHAFDITEERFREIPPPPADGRPNNTGIALGTLGGCLCVFDYFRARIQLDIWTMKEYENAQSWAKYYILKTWIPPAGLSLKDMQSPLTIWRDGEIFLCNYGSPQFISFNPKEKKSSVLKVFCPEIVPYLDILSEVTEIVPSFVTLNKVVQQERSPGVRGPRVLKA